MVRNHGGFWENTPSTPREQTFVGRRRLGKSCLKVGHEGEPERLEAREHRQVGQWDGIGGTDEGYIVRGFADHVKEFGFYSKCNENTFTGFKHGSDVIQFNILKIHLSSGVENELQVRVKKC